MANQNPKGRHPSDPTSPAAQDTRTESAVLAVVLVVHPAQLTASELTRELIGSSGEFAENDAIDRAIRDLIGAGLLHRQGDLVMPTRAALHFNRLGLA